MSWGWNFRKIRYNLIAGLWNCRRERSGFQGWVVFRRKLWWLGRDSVYLCKPVVLLRMTKPFNAQVSPCLGKGKRYLLLFLLCQSVFSLTGGNWGSLLGWLIIEPWEVKRNEGEILPQRTPFKSLDTGIPAHILTWDFHGSWLDDCFPLVESFRIQNFINLSCFHTHSQVCCLEFPNSN